MTRVFGAIIVKSIKIQLNIKEKNITNRKNVAKIIYTTIY